MMMMVRFGGETEKKKKTDKTRNGEVHPGVDENKSRGV